MECVAYNGPGGKGVHAVARCCVTSDLRCQVHVSSQPGRDAGCVQPQHHLTGKTSLGCSWNDGTSAVHSAMADVSQKPVAVV